ncbi:ubiE/COQ5 methyltransferase [Halocaridina rubra]|uniref:UbiE/COQ5 methyltransferase n=1 Tax=Halocaridina rubra TaxID=373956 RepID=A0AAN8WLJ9_HALRR
MDDQTAYKANYRCHEPGISPEEVASSYTDWAPKYDETLCPGRYNGPDIAAEEVALRIPKEQRERVTIIDVAAGTGRVGLLLKQKGFTNIDALEPSKGMMDLLKETGVYGKTYQEFLGARQNSVPDDTYDVLVIAGGMGEGHIPVKGVDDMIRMTKSGGLVIIVMRKEYLEDVVEYKNRLIPHIDTLEKEGKWSKVEVKVVPSYSFNKDGLVFTYKVT